MGQKKIKMCCLTLACILHILTESYDEFASARDLWIVQCLIFTIAVGSVVSTHGLVAVGNLLITSLFSADQAWVIELKINEGSYVQLISKVSPASMYASPW